ncbi:MAG: putative Ig domain-containing protein [Kineosporiaceae bacterium]
MRSTIGLPGGKDVIDLARTPRFTLTGVVTGDAGNAVTTVDLLADGVRIASVAPRSAVPGLRTWSWTTSAPPGVHTLTTCARTASGGVPGTPVTLTVLAPPASATVVSPALRELTPAERAALTRVTPAELTFSGYSSVPVGAVVTAPPSDLAPEGVFRRVTGRRFVGSSTVLSTLPGRLDDAVWQGRVGRVAPLAPLRWSGPVRVVGGAASLEATLDYEARWSLDLAVDVAATWGWGPRPLTTRRVSRFDAIAVVDAPLTLRLAGSGPLSGRVVPDGAAAIRLPAVKLSHAVPVWLAATGRVEVGVEGQVNGEASLVGALRDWSKPDTSGRSQIAYGQLSSFAATAAPSSAGGYPIGVDVTVSSALTVSTDGSPGPTSSIGTVAGVIVEGPCPAPAALLVGERWARTAAPGWDALLGVEQEESYRWPLTLPASRCTAEPLRVRTLQLPPVRAGSAVDAPLLAHGGTAPYTWTASGLPEGLRLVEGRVRGVAREVGPSTVRVQVRDAAGRTAQADVDVIVAAPGALVLTSQPADPLVQELAHGSLADWPVWDEGCTAADAAGLCTHGSRASIGAPEVGINPYGAQFGESAARAEQALMVSPGQAGDYVLTVLVDGHVDVRQDGQLVAGLGDTGQPWREGRRRCDGDAVSNARHLTQVPLRLGAGVTRLTVDLERFVQRPALSWTLVPAAIAPPPPAVQGTRVLLNDGSCPR